MEADAAEAFRWFSASAGQGHHRAEFLLGECYENGRGVARDLKKAAECYAKAQEGGFPGGAFALGRCYENGLGVRQNSEKALELYRQAAERGNKNAEEAVKRLQKKKRFRWPWKKK